MGCLILTFAVFANTLTAGFVNWDDHGYLWLNTLVQPLSGKAIAEMFSGHTCGNYSPFVVFTYCIEHGFDNIVKPGQMVVDNFQPFKYHLTNVLLHLGTTGMAFLLFRSLGLRGWALAFATALFGVHPLRSESVARPVRAPRSIASAVDVISGAIVGTSALLAGAPTSEVIPGSAVEHPMLSATSHQS